MSWQIMKEELRLSKLCRKSHPWCLTIAVIVVGIILMVGIISWFLS